MYSFSSNPLANIGSVENSGLELALNISAINRQNVRWDIRAGANTLHNELTSLGNVIPFPLGGVGRTIVGQQLGVPIYRLLGGRVRDSIWALSIRVIFASTPSARSRAAMARA